MASATDSRAASAPLAEALDKNKQVANDVKEAAEELAVVHAVLQTKLPEEVRAAEVAHAVAQTVEVEKRLGESGKSLDEVNATLAREARAAKP